MKKILVVEDAESQRFLCRDELAEAGYEVILAANGKEALKQLDKFKPAPVILDIVIPVIDGMETLGKIIRKERDVSIILNTSYPSGTVKRTNFPAEIRSDSSSNPRLEFFPRAGQVFIHA